MKTRTSSPSRCTWMRAPSSFHSTAAGRIRSSAAGTSVGGLREHRLHGRRAARAGSSRAHRVLRRWPRRRPCRGLRPASRRAARREPERPPLARPPRPSPPRARPDGSRRSGAREGIACSRSVARANRPRSSSRRAACEPAPVIEPIRRSASSTSSSSSVAGGGAGGGTSRSVAHPTPMDPCGRDAREIGHRHPHLVGPRRRQAARESIDLLASRRRRRDVGRCLRDLVEQHRRRPARVIRQERGRA